MARESQQRPLAVLQSLGRPCVGRPGKEISVGVGVRPPPIRLCVVLAHNWNFIGGFTGYSAFRAFFGIGVYTTGLPMLARQPFWVGLLVAALSALLLSLPVLRLRAHSLAIATPGTAKPCVSLWR